MSLDITLVQDGVEVFTANITHNCKAMSKKMNIYQALWNPSDVVLFLNWTMLGICNTFYIKVYTLQNITKKLLKS